MRIFRRVLIIFISFLLFCLLIGVIFSTIYEDAVINYLKKYLDKHLITEVEVNKINFSIFKKFPKASVELTDIVAKSGMGFSAYDFGYINTDTLLSAKSVFFEFSLPGIIRGEYILKNVKIANGELILLMDHKGKNNFSVWERGKQDTKSEFNFSLPDISLNNISIKLIDLSSNLAIESRSKKMKLKANFNETSSYFIGKGNLFINKLSIGKNFDLSNKDFNVDIDLLVKKDHYQFNKCTVASGKFKMLLKGDIKKQDKTFLNLNISLSKVNLSDLIEVSPGFLKDFKQKYSVTGTADINGRITGAIDKKTKPHIDLQYYVKKASITFLKNQKKITGLSLKGNYSNGALNHAATSVLQIDKYNANQGKSEFSGYLKIKNFKAPDIELSVKSDIVGAEFIKFLDIDTFQLFSGSIKSDITLKGKLSSLKKIRKEEIIALDRHGTILLDDFSFKFMGSAYEFQNINGTLGLDSPISFKEVTGLFMGNDFKISYTMENLPEYLFKKGNVHIDGRIQMHNLNFNSIINKGINEKDKKENFLFSDRISLNSQFSIGALTYGKFSATDVTGEVNYYSRTYTFSSFHLNSVNGHIAGNASIQQVTGNKLAINCKSELRDIDIQKMFYSFNNFGQDVILDKNIKGDISGTIDFTAQWDDTLKLIGESVFANADLDIRNGELIDYAPMMGLSKFIAVEELKNISFQTLKNNIVIKNRMVTIPEMDINSSAFNIKGSGIHTFDNNYDYRIQVELSELLARKAEKKRKEVEEFGIVEDDGLGRINIPIKIIGKGNEYKYSIDRGKALEKFKTNMAKEGESLKEIFNPQIRKKNTQKTYDNQNKKFIIDQDNGVGGRDSIFERKEEKKREKQPQFIIEWDDEDNTLIKDTTDE